MSSSPPPAWRVVWWFGFVSLAADMVYEGARSVYGPLLAALGASAVVVGLVTGAGEAVALVARLAFGPLADRTGRYWSLTIAGYGLTAVCVPLLCGVAVLSDTTVHGEHCLRVAIANHRTQRGDLDLLVREVVRTGDRLRAHAA